MDALNELGTFQNGMDKNLSESGMAFHLSIYLMYLVKQKLIIKILWAW